MKITKNRYPWPVIETAVLLTQDLTYRKVSERMREIGVDVSHKTIYQWTHKFSDKVKKPSTKRITQYRIEESYVRCNGEPLYMYRAIDSKKATLGLLLRSKRNIRVAEKYFANNEQ